MIPKPKLGQVSSTQVNPFIYGIMNTKFRLAFERALSCGRYGNENTDQNDLRNGVRQEFAGGLETPETANSTFTQKKPDHQGYLLKEMHRGLCHFWQREFDELFSFFFSSFFL